MVKRDSSTRQYPADEADYPARLSRGVELPALKPAHGRIGPYELIAELGSGGMGTVYLARRSYEVGVTRTVALKTLRRDLSSQKDLVEMFLDEARITARISHPYVCSVLDLGIDQGVPYVAMDYLVGEPLSRLGPLMAEDHSDQALSMVVRIIANLCEGLHAAHELRDERGELVHVVHRDVSPDNLFVLYDGSVRVADFGIASTKELQKSGRGTTLAGKSGYMAPEQLRGLELDRRADLWSMGVVLWELLSGKRLFRPGSQIAAVVAVLERPIDPVSKYNPQVPSGLEAVVSRALERDRDKRYPTARAMALDLEQVLARCFGPVSAAQVSHWLDQQFPGCQAFRRTIVSRTEDLRAELLKLEFDPTTSKLSARPPGDPALQPELSRMVTDAVMAQLEQRTPGKEGDTGSRALDARSFSGKRQDSLASVHVELSEHESIAVPRSAEPPQRDPGVAVSSMPSPRKRAARLLAGGAALTVVVALLAFSLRKPSTSTQRAAGPEPHGPIVQPPREPAPAAAEPAPVEEVTPPSAPAPRVIEEPAPQAGTTTEAGDAAAPLAHRPAPQQPVGEVYVFLLRGKPIKVPALLKLPLKTTSLTFRRIGSATSAQIPVAPQPGRPTMLRLD
jgi:serine/threonine protein kinase